MLVISLGDPWSINVECISRILSARSGDSHQPLRHPLVLVGSLAQWNWQTKHQVPADARIGPDGLTRIAALSDAVAGRINFFDVDPDGTLRDPATLGTAACGIIAVRSLRALRDLPRGIRLAVLTAPIDKHSVNSAGFGFPGQTEFFADLWQHDAIMLLAGPQLRVALATNHVALADVPRLISVDRITSRIELLVQTLRKVFGIASPRIGVAALNPHAGDGGLFGKEDETIIRPAVARVANLLDGQATVSGPHPADTVFFRAAQGEFDAVLAMYHDQGLGPLKTLHFDTAVNISGGLPHLRVSPDHGPARDLVGQGKASIASFAAAFKLCEDWLDAR